MDSDSETSFEGSEEVDDIEEDVEMTYGRSEACEKVVLPGSNKRIPNRGTVYDKAKIIGIRAEWINRGGDIFIPTNGYNNAIEIAEAELAARRCPVITEREITKGKLVYIKRFSANDLTF